MALDAGLDRMRLGRYAEESGQTGERARIEGLSTEEQDLVAKKCLAKSGHHGMVEVGVQFDIGDLCAKDGRQGDHVDVRHDHEDRAPAGDHSGPTGEKSASGTAA